MIARSYLIFSVSRVGLGNEVVETLDRPSFFHGYLPFTLLCPSLAHSSYLYDRFIDAGDVQLFVNLDDTSSVPSIAAFIEVRLAQPTTLLGTDYQIIQEISGGTLHPVPAPFTQVIFGNGLDLRPERFQVLKADFEREGAIAVVLGTEVSEGQYILPPNARLLKARTCTFDPYEIFYQRIHARLGLEP